jgi:RNA polymerase sigma factor for flagellar operon FliA
VILSLYYERDLTYREIGAVLQVTESRVCQLLRAVHGKLRGALTDWS